MSAATFTVREVSKQENGMRSLQYKWGLDLLSEAGEIGVVPRLWNMVVIRRVRKEYSAVGWWRHTGVIELNIQG